MRANWRSRGVVLGGLLVVSSVACELVVGIGEQPHLVDGGDGGAGEAEAGPLTCTLPAAGDPKTAARVRLANVVPSLDGYDFCLTPSGGAPPAAGVLASGGGGCPALLYRNVLAPYALPSGTYKVDAVAGGATDCSNPVATAPSVNFDPATTTTVILFGTGGGAQLQLKAFREEESTISEPKVRFINAWSDGPSGLDIGTTSKDELPATIIGTQLYAQNAPYANVAPQSAKVDSNGYFTVIGQITIPMGFGESGTDAGATSVAVVRNVSTNGSLSTFAIGTQSDPRFPVDLMVCSQDAPPEGIYTPCSNKSANDVVVDVYNIQLQGRFTPLEVERRPAIQNAIANFDGDFACIAEAWDEKDKAAIINAAKAHFPYAATFTTDLNTVPNDPRDQNGQIPPAYTTAACQANPQVLQDFLTCLSQNCTTGAAGDMNGQFPENDLQCIINSCLGPGAALLSDPECYSCTITQIESGSTFANSQTQCTTNPLARFAFNGDVGIILLSTRPFLPASTPTDGGLPPDDAPALFVLPSTEYRAAAIRASVDLTALPQLHTYADVYCAILTTPATSSQRPYSGQYGGGGGTSAEQWANENLLQAQQLTNWVKTVSGARKRRAIVAGEYYTGPGISGLTPLNVQSYNAMTQVIPLAMAPGYTPTCTYCGTNPIVAAGGGSFQNQWSSYALLSDLAVPETLSNTVIVTDPVVTTDAGADGGTLMVPPSLYYGMRTVIRVRN
ncbi:MAG TPA: hypothetical protein VLM85_24820 [Polyangiaceae bacterium]|nr:hypothetical protein [Polyangiaceae bacterium]